MFCYCLAHLTVKLTYLLNKVGNANTALKLWHVQFFNYLRSCKTQKNVHDIQSSFHFSVQCLFQEFFTLDKHLVNYT